MAGFSQDQLGELLSAYLDGELDERDTRLVERILQEDGAARALFAELRATIEVVHSLPRHAAPESIQEDLRLRLERSELLGDPGDAPVVRGRRVLTSGRRLSMAAMIGLVVVAGAYFFRDWDAGLQRPAGERAVVASKEVDDETKQGPAGGGEAAAREGVASRRRHSDVASEDLSEGAKRPPAPGRRVGPADRRETVLADAWTDAETSASLLKRKLTPATASRSLRRHDFDGEPVRISVDVADDAGRSATMAALLEGLRRRRVPEVSAMSVLRSRNEQTASGSFFYRGKAGANFKADGSDRVLVSLPASDLEDLLDDLVRPSAVKGVSLKAGPLVVRGENETRTALRQAGSRRFTAPTSAPGDRPAVAVGGHSADKDPLSSILVDAVLPEIGGSTRGPSAPPSKEAGSTDRGTERSAESAQSPDDVGRRNRADTAEDQAKPALVQERPAPPGEGAVADPAGAARDTRAAGHDAGAMPGEAKRQEPDGLREPASLVQRRTLELDRGTQRTATGGAEDHVGDRRGYVTLVVEVVAAGSLDKEAPAKE